MLIKLRNVGDRECVLVNSEEISSVHRVRASFGMSSACTAVRLKSGERLEVCESLEEIEGLIAAGQGPMTT